MLSNSRRQSNVSHQRLETQLIDKEHSHPKKSQQLTKFKV